MKRTAIKRSNWLRKPSLKRGKGIKRVGAIKARRGPLQRADAAFSKQIRERDQVCQEPFCNEREGLECSHYFRRSIYATRYDEDNCIALCHDSHVRYETQKHEGGLYWQLMILRLGRERFEALARKAEGGMKRTEAIEEFWKAAHRRQQ